MRKTMGAVLGSAAAIVIVGGAGLATAAASPAGSAASGTEHFSLMTTQPSASKYVIIAAGVFTAGGTDVSGSKTDTAKFANGTFKVHHGGALHVTKEKVNPKTCLAQFAGTTRITLGGGTGAYKGISGSGTAKISALEVAKRNSKGACNLNSAPASNEETITATVHIKL
ncbi:MAG TPA: hypothetical protein VMA73_20330 [Streptosporangiaceae bacterium]|nr:hypothetical protein [Streptosporangiaceae bacterium]